MPMGKTYNITVSNELCHHGIRGQHWGITNGPPYPLENEKKIQNRVRIERTKKYVKAAALSSVKAGAVILTLGAAATAACLKSTMNIAKSIPHRVINAGQASTNSALSSIGNNSVAFYSNNVSNLSKYQKWW